MGPVAPKCIDGVHDRMYCSTWCNSVQHGGSSPACGVQPTTAPDGTLTGYSCDCAGCNGCPADPVPWEPPEMFSCELGGARCHTFWKGCMICGLDGFNSARYAPWGAHQAREFCAAIGINHGKAASELFHEGPCLGSCRTPSTCYDLSRRLNVALNKAVTMSSQVPRP